MEKIASFLRARLQSFPVTRPAYLLLRQCKRGGIGLASLFKSGWFIATRIIPGLLKYRRQPVLLSRQFGAGDIICTFPAAQRLRARHPQAEFIYNCGADFDKLPLLAGVASRTVSTDVPALKRYWPFFFAAIYEFECGNDGKNYYVSDEFPIEAFCQQHGVPPTRDHPVLILPDATRSRASQRLARGLHATGPLIVFHTGPTWLIREWPHASWCQLIGRLQSAGFVNLVQVGASRNAFLGELKTQPIPGVFSLVDQLDLEETIGVIAQASLLVGIDSGLLHMAAWVQTPFVGIWGPTSPEMRFSGNCRQSPVVSTVPCQGCHHRLPCLHWISGCQNNIACMTEIAVERVFQACLQELNRQK